MVALIALDAFIKGDNILIEIEIKVAKDDKIRELAGFTSTTNIITTTHISESLYAQHLEVGLLSFQTIHFLAIICMTIEQPYQYHT